MLRVGRTVIVDEIHAVADDKRGSHLALSLARLDALTGAAAAEDRAVGHGEADRRGRAVPRATTRTSFKSGHRRAMDLAVEVPRDELGAVASNEMWAEIYDRLADADRRSIAPRWCSSTRGGCPSASRITLARAAGRERRAAASRQPVARAAARGRAAAEERRTARGGGHGVARTGHRYRHGRSGVPDRLAALDRGGAAARRPRRALGRRAAARAASSRPRATS